MKKLLLLLLFALPAYGQIQNINLGASPGDRTGDTLRSGGTKINTNFAQVSGMWGPTGLLRGNGPLPNPMTAATALDVTNVFTGPCTGTVFLRGDGVCAVASTNLSSISVYPAQSFGSCTWNATSDVGPCINLAVAAASAAGGGTVALPAGTFGLATQVSVTTSGVHLQGAGVGNVRDNLSSANALAVTKLKWIGTATSASTPMIIVQTPNNSTPTLYSVDVQGITADCNSLSGIGIELAGVSYSTFRMAAAECTGIADIYVTVPSVLVETGNQHNDFWLYARTTSPTNLATGIFFEGCQSCGAGFNTSYNRYWELYTWFNNGDGIVFANSDNNEIQDVRTFATNYGTATGYPLVCANDTWAMANGVVPNLECRLIHFKHYGGKGFWVQGHQAGAVITPGVSNAGTAALTNVTIPTTGTANQAQFVLNFASTANVNANYSVNCGAQGYACGLNPGNPIVQVNNTANTVTFAAGFDFGIASSTNITFTFGYTSQAAAGPGSYTITYCSSAVPTGCSAWTGSGSTVTGYYIAYTGTGTGHTQTGINTTVQGSGAALIFTDVVIPWSGTPSNGDNWTINLPTPTYAVRVEDDDTGNNTATPTFEYGASGWWWPLNQALPWSWNLPCNYVSIGQQAQGQTAGIANGGNSGVAACTWGGVNNTASGNFATVAGGNGNNSTGFAAFSTNQTNTASGTNTAAFGKLNTASGTGSVVTGTQVTDRGNLFSFCNGGGQNANLGDTQTCIRTLHGTGNSTTAIRLTADGNAATTNNCINEIAGTGWGFTLSVSANDRTTPTKNATWQQIKGLMTRPAAGNVAVQNDSVASPTYSNGTLTGSSLSITADTANECLNISFTPPTSNTDNWDIQATIITTEAW